MGFDKLMAPLRGKSVLQLSLETFLVCPEISEVILVTDPERFGSLDLCGQEQRVTRVDGGTERQGFGRQRNRSPLARLCHRRHSRRRPTIGHS